MQVEWESLYIMVLVGCSEKEKKMFAIAIGQSRDQSREFKCEKSSYNRCIPAVYTFFFITQPSHTLLNTCYETCNLIISFPILMLMKIDFLRAKEKGNWKLRMNLKSTKGQIYYVFFFIYACTFCKFMLFDYFFLMNTIKMRNNSLIFQISIKKISLIFQGNMI